ncbi:PKD domain-containing protein [Myxococcota bacterium]|nr:PKD domain-containing protein [Myxococcota bacterium]
MTLSDPNFVHETLYQGNGMISFAFGPSGQLYVAEKQGRVLHFAPNGTGGFAAPTVFADLRTSVDSVAESGLLGLALDPDFATNRYIYLLHTTTTDQRIIRYTADATLSVASGGSTLILSGLPRSQNYHKAGNIAFHPNDRNSLYVSIGDDNDIAGSQNLTRYVGKILRINKTNGQGFTDNPWQDGTTTSIRSRIWAIGLRNPFRFAFHPNAPVADVLYSSENGNSTDRLSFIRRGSNGSWNIQGDSGGFLSPPDTNHRVLATQTPFLIGIAVVRGGPFADPAYPNSDVLYLANGQLDGGSITRWRLTGTNLDSVAPVAADGTRRFATGLAVQGIHLAFGPDGALYMTQSGPNTSLEGTNRLSRIRYIGGRAPVASFTTSPSPATGAAPLTVTFTDRSTDSDGTIASWLWTFGDGTTSTAQSPTKVFSAAGTYTTTLQVTDNSGLRSTTSATINATAVTQLTLTGRIYDGRDTLNNGFPVSTVLRLYAADGVTPIRFTSGTGTNGNEIFVPAGGTFNTTIPVNLTAPGVVVAAGENLTNGIKASYRAFNVPIGALTHTQSLSFHLALGAIRGRILDTRGEGARVDLGVARTSPTTLHAVPGGRDYLSGAGFAAMGVNHRIESDVLGYYYVPIRTGQGGADFYLDVVGDTNAGSYFPFDWSATVGTDALVTANLTVGLRNGGGTCDDLTGIPAGPAVDYDTMIQSIWTGSCTGCHNSSGGANGGLDLSPAMSYGELVGMMSGEVPGMLRVAPGDATSSYLMEKINCAEPQIPTRMRPAEQMPLADQARIRDWINQGARPSPVDTDTATPNLANGTPTTVTLATAGDLHYQIYVYPGATSLTVVSDGPNCTATSCPLNADVYVRRTTRATDTLYDCRPYLTHSDETCTFTSPAEGWYYVRVRARTGSGALTLTATQNGMGIPSPPPPNRAPTASFTRTITGFSVAANATGSTDPDGDTLTYSWTFGNGATATGAQPTVTYAAPGTYTITLTATDGRGGSATSAQSVTITDPDTTTANLTPAVGNAVTVPAATDAYRKLWVPAGRTRLTFSMTGPACNGTSCFFETDLSARLGSRPTNTTFTCRSANRNSNTESCVITAPASGFWYVRVRNNRGNGTVTITPTY